MLEQVSSKEKKVAEEDRIYIGDEEAMTTTDMRLNSSIPESIVAIEQKGKPTKIESDEEID